MLIIIYTHTSQCFDFLEDGVDKRKKISILLVLGSTSKPVYINYFPMW